MMVTVVGVTIPKGEWIIILYPDKWKSTKWKWLQHGLQLGNDWKCMASSPTISVLGFASELLPKTSQNKRSMPTRTGLINHQVCYGAPCEWRYPLANIYWDRNAMQFRPLLRKSAFWYSLENSIMCINCDESYAASLGWKIPKLSATSQLRL